MGGTLKPSSALPLNGVSGLRSTQRYQFQTETRLELLLLLASLWQQVF